MAVALPFIIAGASVLSAGMGAVGAISQGQSAGSAADYNAAIQRNNSLTALRVSTMREEAIRRRNAIDLGAQQAAVAQAGVGFGGSSADIVRQSRIEGSLNALNERYSGQLQSQNYANSANLLSYQAGQDRTAGYLGSGTAILSGIGDYGQSYAGQAQIRKWRGTTP